MNLRSLVVRHHEAFNDRDLEVWSGVFDEDVEIEMDGAAFRGVAAARAHITAIFREFPRLRIHGTRFVAESDDTIVVEHQILNGDPSGGPLRPQGSVCEIYRVSDGRVVAYKGYYAPEGADREDVVNVPSRAEGSKMAEEQAALRRVATLVARGVSQDELFAAVNEEVGWLVGADPISLMRFEADDTVTLVAAWSAGDAGFPIGARRPMDDELRSMRDEGHALQFGPMELPLDGPFVEDARQLGIRSAVGVPIVVDGRVWGAAFVASTREEPFSEGTMARIAGFTELVATAIANAQARAELRTLVEELRALRGLAMLIARGASQQDVFDAVVTETSRVLGEERTALQRYDGGGFATIVAVSGDPGPVGLRVPLEGGGVAARVRRTGRVARVDRDDGVPGAQVARDLGVGGEVGAPVVVDRRLWGLLSVVSRDRPLPPSLEDRLAQFADLTATAIANAESRAALTASRARVVATADETRRRLERDLHDGAQQRLVHTILTLKLARDALAQQDGPAAALVGESLVNAERANEDLRELVLGILPASLHHGGLRGGVRSLVRTIAVPVTVEVPAERLPEALEMTAYFVVAEALTNVVKHAEAASARVAAAIEGGALRLEVSDDGRGGADASRGSGLVGLADRVAAGGGTLTIASPPGEGTTLSVAMPLHS
jgi:signal transduction histidine kinase/ketosteroid isomerase-like protein